uniref:Uncharacterized protein n=1 Tax=Anguilla anguilla TaxID=7936 RepID=A0A0E9V2M8_ANGAN
MHILILMGPLKKPKLVDQ